MEKRRTPFDSLWAPCLPLSSLQFVWLQKLHFIVDLTLTDRRDCIRIRRVLNATGGRSQAGGAVLQIKLALYQWIAICIT